MKDGHSWRPRIGDLISQAIGYRAGRTTVGHSRYPIDFFSGLTTHRRLDIHQRRLARSKTRTVGRVETRRWYDPKEEVDP